jgi:hypothetical protein
MNGVAHTNLHADAASNICGLIGIVIYQVVPCWVKRTNTCITHAKLYIQCRWQEVEMCDDDDDDDDDINSKAWG